MRDWLMVISPVGIVVFFATHPDRFNDMVHWLNQFVR
jgi:hypothetical protein